MTQVELFLQKETGNHKHLTYFVHIFFVYCRMKALHLMSKISVLGVNTWVLLEVLMEAKNAPLETSKWNA